MLVRITKMFQSGWFYKTRQSLLIVEDRVLFLTFCGDLSAYSNQKINEVCLLCCALFNVLSMLPIFVVTKVQ